MSSIQVDSILDKFCGYSEKTKKSKCTTSVYNTQFVDGKETSKKMSDRTCMAPIIDIKRRKGDFVVVYLNFQTANNAHLSSFWNAFEEFGNSYNESFANSHVDYSNPLPPKIELNNSLLPLMKNGYEFFPKNFYYSSCNSWIYPI